MKTTVALLILFTLLLPSSFAQDYTQWGLPEGAKARLSKGQITGNIAYSPDGTRLAVASRYWVYQEVALLAHKRTFSPDLTVASGGVTRRCVYGTQ